MNYIQIQDLSDVDYKNIGKLHYTELLDTLKVTRPKCKCCGEDIIYDNTNAKLISSNIRVDGKSFMTIKSVNGIEYKLLVCQKCLLKEYPNIKNLSRIFNTMSEPTKFAFNIPNDVYLDKKAKYAVTLSNLIKKYGENEGKQRWKSYCQKQSETNTFEYKQKVYGWTKEQFKEYNKSRGVTLKNLVKKYGEELGNQKWDEYCKKQSLTKSWDYVVDKYGIDRAREINKSKSLTLENFIKKYGEELGNQKFNDYYLNKSKGVSKISQILFSNLDKYLCDKYTTYYHNKNGEYIINYGNGVYYLDYYIKELNICIEFNGGCFHGDERLYRDDEYCNPYNKTMTAKQLRENDRKRYEYLFDNHNIKTFVIWELDYDIESFEYIDYINNTLKIKL